MHVKKYLGLCAAVVASVVFALPVPTWAATHEVVLHNFNPPALAEVFPGPLWYPTRPEIAMARPIRVVLTTWGRFRTFA